jgi:hypothetical protein
MLVLIPFICEERNFTVTRMMSPKTAETLAESARSEEGFEKRILSIESDIAGAPLTFKLRQEYKKRESLRIRIDLSDNITS